MMLLAVIPMVLAFCNGELAEWRQRRVRVGVLLAVDADLLRFWRDEPSLDGV